MHSYKKLRIDPVKIQIIYWEDQLLELTIFFSKTKVIESEIEF